MTRRPAYFPELQARWERGRALETAAYAEEEKPRLGRTTEVAATLVAMYRATGRGIYAEAHRAMMFDGFLDDDGACGRFAPWWEKQAEATYIERMKFLVERDADRSVRHAAARTAAEYLVPGKNFEAVVKRLERAYSAGPDA
jgi:hypothetical protein